MTKQCKRCNGTGKVYEDKKGDSAEVKYRGLRFTTGKKTSVKGTNCPRCYGSGVK